MKALVNLWLIELKSIVNISINCSWRNNTVEKCFHSECFSPLFIILYAWSEVLLSLILFLYWPFKRLKNIKMYTQLVFLSRCLLNSGASLGRRLKHTKRLWNAKWPLFSHSWTVEEINLRVQVLPCPEHVKHPLDHCWSVWRAAPLT